MGSCALIRTTDKAGRPGGEQGSATRTRDSQAINRITSRRKRDEVHANNDRLCAFCFVCVRRKATESWGTRKPWEAERVNEGLVQRGEKTQT
jgi:hypothetical protein